MLTIYLEVDVYFQGGILLQILGTHLLLELRSCNPVLLTDLDYIEKSMVQIALETGATIIGQSFHKFLPGGVTGVLAISESHISIHTWPEHKYAAVDIFTCNKKFISSKAAELIINIMECQDPDIREIKRGIF